MLLIGLILSVLLEIIFPYSPVPASTLETPIIVKDTQNVTSTTETK